LKPSSRGCIKNWITEYEPLSTAETHLSGEPGSVST
jgi:hypothetical protein